MPTALVLGATGLVGRALLERLLQDDAYTRVSVLARRPPRREHPRLAVREADFERLDAQADAFAVDHVFCCLGTTLKQAGSRAAFRRVDYDYVLQAARLAARSGAGHFVWISSLGTSPDSRVFYSRVKGELEAAVAGLPLRAWSAVRPSLLLGQRSERRAGEAMGIVLGRAISPLLVGPLRVYRPIAATRVAEGMIALANGKPPPRELEYRSSAA